MRIDSSCAAASVQTAANHGRCWPRVRSLSHFTGIARVGESWWMIVAKLNLWKADRRICTSTRAGARTPLGDVTSYVTVRGEKRSA